MATIRRVPFAQRDISADVLKPEQIAQKYAKKIRHGKTRRDHARGAHHTMRLNRQERSAYTASAVNPAAAGASVWSTFPWSMCNGRKTRALRNRPSKKN